MRGGRNRAAALAAIFASTFLVNAARAQQAPSPVTLTWNAPAGCSDSAAILKEVGRLRGDASNANQLTATANVTLDPSGVWSLQITTILPDGTHGERQIQAESCKAAANATASILALALTESERKNETGTPTPSPSPNPNPSPSPNPNPNPNPNPSPSPSPSPSPTPRPSPTPSAAPAGSRSSSLSPHLYIGASFGGTTGDLPSLGLGALGDLGVAYGLLRVEGYGGYWAFARARFSKPGGANFQMLSVGARTCLSFGDTFSVGPCAAFEVGSMRGESFDVTAPSSGSGLTAEALLGGLGTVSLDKTGLFRLRALLEIGANVDRPQFVLDGVGFVHQPAPIVGRGTIGAELRF